MKYDRDITMHKPSKKKATSWAIKVEQRHDRWVTMTPDQIYEEFMEEIRQSEAEWDRLWQEAMALVKAVGPNESPAA
jgi:hypothetical protein